uniref:ABC-type nitrate/sulfonate/bicarbonate transport system, substrate-binding protein n=1 Tax=Candidatus Kentrum sp. TC TaxID=2126339 RepID=A0A450YMQ0_9GAMM|nr:MAG: ABC-type nitrate/sulfonate/bicarbonate transport system, substrate-binding protein [Candidatus Kentron sp. TC]
MEYLPTHFSMRRFFDATMKRNKLFTGLSVIAVIILVWALLPKSPDTDYADEGEPRTRPATQLKIGYVTIAGALPLFVAEKYGYFREAGFETELVRFKSSNEIAIAAATNKIDLVGICATNAVLDAAVASSTRFGAFLLNGYTKPSETEQATDYLLARKGITLEQLKGKRIAFFPGSISRVFANLIFPRLGLAVEDVEYIEMSPPNWISAMETGVVDAVTAVEPFAQMLRDRGRVDVLVEGYYAQVMPNVPLSGAWFVAGRLPADAEARIYSAFGRALDLIQSDRERALRAFSDFTKISPDVYRRIGLNRWRLIEDDEARESIRRFVAILLESGELRKAPASYLWAPRYAP